LCAGDQSLALSFAARATFSRAASVTTQNSLSQRIEVSGAGTPPAIVNKINAGMVRMMADAAFAQRLINQGAGPRASTPAPFRGSMDAWPAPVSVSTRQAALIPPKAGPGGDAKLGYFIRGEVAPRRISLRTQHSCPGGLSK
jgi:hypothetical protein